MSKILSKSGDSLADVYDVQGSMAGIDQLQSQDVNLVHEMGSTIFSERLRAEVAVGASGDVLQGDNFDVSIIAFTTRPFIRLHGIFVFVDTAARILHASVSIEDEISAGNSVPIWAWDGNETQIRVSVSGSAQNVFSLDGDVAYNMLPSFLVGALSPGLQASTPNLTLRGKTATFGAGTVKITAHALVSFPTRGGVNSRGLPLPGW